MLDPRIASVEKRLAGVDRVLAVTGGKGGTGKSFVSCALALACSRAGLRVGLLDLDLTGPSDHVILGFETRFPAEEFGIDPPELRGIKCMSIAHFAQDTPAPLRGEDLTNALLELLAITRWGELDVLVIDMPPGLSDTSLDLLRLLDRAEYLLVSTPSRVVLETVGKTMRFLRELNTNVVGVIENMAREEGTTVCDVAARHGVSHLGVVPFDGALEGALGDPDRLAATAAAKAVAEVTERLRLRAPV